MPLPLQSESIHTLLKLRELGYMYFKYLLFHLFAQMHVYHVLGQYFSTQVHTNHVGVSLNAGSHFVGPG